MITWAVNTSKYYNQGIKKTVDIMTSSQVGQNHPNRHKLIRIVRTMDGITPFTKVIWFDKYVEKLNQSKIFATCSIWHSVLVGKYVEAMACGTFLLGTKAEDLERCGYKDGYHLVTYKDDFSDFEDKARYYLEHDGEREEIATNGMKFVREHHSQVTRVKELTEIIEVVL